MQTGKCLAKKRLKKRKVSVKEQFRRKNTGAEYEKSTEKIDGRLSKAH